VSFFSVPGDCGAGAASSEVPPPEALVVVSAEFVETVSSEFLVSLSLLAVRFFENAGVISMKIKVDRPAQLAMNRFMNIPLKSLYGSERPVKNQNLKQLIHVFFQNQIIEDPELNHLDISA
jgi:hypothetical protein